MISDQKYMKEFLINISHPDSIAEELVRDSICQMSFLYPVEMSDKNFCITGSFSFATLNNSSAIFVILWRINFPLFVFGSESTKYTPPRNLKPYEKFSTPHEIRTIKNEKK